VNDLRNAVRDSDAGQAQGAGAGWIGRTFRFEPGFLGFSGHFPGYPLVPAFVQVLASIVVMERAKTTALEIVALNSAKFRKEIRPGTEVTVECKETADLPLLAFQVRIRDEEGDAASFSVQCVAVRR